MIIDFSDAYYFYAVYVSNLNIVTSGPSSILKTGTNTIVSTKNKSSETSHDNECDFIMEDESAEKTALLDAGDQYNEEELEIQELNIDTDNKMKHIVVNKRYFEKYLQHSISNYIVFENFISTEWYL